MENFVDFTIGVVAFGFIAGCIAGCITLFSFMLKNAAKLFGDLFSDNSKNKKAENSEKAETMVCEENLENINAMIVQEECLEDVVADDSVSNQDVDWSVYDTPTFLRKQQSRQPVIEDVVGDKESMFNQDIDWSVYDTPTFLRKQQSRQPVIEDEVSEWSVDPNTGLPFSGS